MRKAPLAAAALFWACATAAPPSAPSSREPAAPPALGSAPPSAFLDSCSARCSRQRAMMAVSAQMIEAQCRGDCEAAWALPLVERRSDLDLHAGRAVRVLGVFRGTGERTGAVELADGARLELAGADLLDLVEGARIVAAGQLRGREAIEAIEALGSL